MASDINTIDKIRELIKSGKIQDIEQVLCKGLLMPFNTCNSGSRKQMFGSQIEQKLELLKAELARVSTGYENRFGDRSSSIIQTDRDLVVVHKISKFSFDPDRFYYLIVYDPSENSFGLIERKSYEHFTETYGVLYNNDFIDKLKPGNKINCGSTIRKSLSYDEYNNRKDGVNLLATYMSNEATKEDGILISNSASIKLASPLIKKVPIVINDNDIPLNMYARNLSDYKCFPDIGESTEYAKGILCAIRRQKKEEMLFTQSRQNLSRIMISDDKYTVEGTVVDIDIYANNPELLADSYYFSQLKYYNDEHIRFMTEFMEKVEPLVSSGYYCSYELKKVYTQFKKILNGGQYLKDNIFSNVIVELTLVEYNQVKIGDKISNRYGGKGVVSDILPDEMMPLLDNGRRVELIYNSSTCINRENNGQLNEMNLNFVSDRIVDHVNNLECFDINYVVNLYIDYLSIINKDLAKQMEEYILSADPEDQTAFMKNMFDEGIILPINPVKDNINIDTLAEIKRKFPFVKQYRVQVPQIGSDGKYRYVNTRRTLECGEQYIWRLKQYAEEKFSVVSLSATTLKNENTRDNSKRSYKSPYAKTCVKFGDMETGDMLHLGVEEVIVNLLLVSLAPKARREVGRQLTEGPIFDIDIKLPEDASNRSVEILNAYLLTIGLRLVFIKIPKRINRPIKYVHKREMLIRPKKLIRPLVYENGDNYCIPATIGDQTLMENQNKKKILQYINKE